ncbi:MAG: ATP-binding protein [Spirochaetia bacterium]|jgi:predicted kinase
MLVIFRGLPGTGKSHLVRELIAKQSGFLVVSRDILRAAVLPHPSYTSEEKVLIDDLVCSMTGFLLDRGWHVVIDGMALSSAARVDQLVRIAVSRGVPERIIECVCRQDTALSRIAGDDGSHPAGDRGEAVYFEVKARFQPVAHPFLTVDTDRADELNIAAILEYVRSGI